MVKRQQVADCLLQQVELLDRPAVQAQMGTFILREDADTVNMEDFWRDKAVAAPKLAKLALRFLAVAPTESSVVPGPHGLTHSPMPRLAPTPFFLVFPPPHYQSRQLHR